jgi:hypothetical protein
VPDLPTPDRKRKILHDERTDPETLNQLADAFREAGRLGEALEMLAVTRDEKRLRSLRDLAVARGEVFVLTQTERLLREKAPEKVWRAVAETALAEGRFRQATRAFERAGDAAKAGEAASRIPPPPPCRPEKAAPEEKPATTE